MAVVGQQHRGALTSTYQQEVDTATLYKNVSSAYLATVTIPEYVPLVVDRAVRTALAQQVLTAVVLPHDVQVRRVRRVSGLSEATKARWPSSGLPKPTGRRRDGRPSSRRASVSGAFPQIRTTNLSPGPAAPGQATRRSRRLPEPAEARRAAGSSGRCEPRPRLAFVEAEESAGRRTRSYRR